MKNLSFAEALIALKQGKKVCRPHWVKDTHYLIADGEIVFVSDYSKNVQFTIPQAEILAIDWEIIDEVENNPNKERIEWLKAELAKHPKDLSRFEVRYIIDVLNGKVTDRSQYQRCLMEAEQNARMDWLKNCLDKCSPDGWVMSGENKQVIMAHVKGEPIAKFGIRRLLPVIKDKDSVTSITGVVSGGGVSGAYCNEGASGGVSGSGQSVEGNARGYSGSHPKTKGMTFGEAVKAMKSGKLIRQPSWPGRQYFQVTGYIIRDSEGHPWSPTMVHIEATDWEIVE